MNKYFQFITSKTLWTNLLESARLLRHATLFPQSGLRKLYPRVIQLPITGKCNSRCLMCNIWKMLPGKEAKVEEFSKFLKDDIFQEVTAVGINGGEPSLLANLPEYAEEILKLPKIASLNIISNGFSEIPLLQSLRKIKTSCESKNVKLHVSISLDGVGKIHDRVRGISNAFTKAVKTIDTIFHNRSIYCDSFDLSCTVIQQNIEHIIELDTFAKKHGYPIKYRLGIPNKRIGSNTHINSYSVADSSFRQSAKEFFHDQMHHAKSLADKFKYFSIFTWLNSKNPKRLMGCAWKEEGITLDSSGNIYYCAVQSDSIGCLRKANGKNIFFNTINLRYRNQIINECCESCIHDYYGKPELKFLLYFFWILFLDSTFVNMYRFYARLIK